MLVPKFLLGMTSLLIGQLFGTDLYFEKTNVNDFFHFPLDISPVSFEFKSTRNTVWLTFSCPDTALKAKEYVEFCFPDSLVKFSRPTKKVREKIESGFRPKEWPSGLRIIPDWITEEEEVLLVNEIDANPWDVGIKRRVQHYGFVFKYSTLKATESAENEFPPLCQEIVERIGSEMDQLTVNEYVAGIGIGSHCDTHSAFTESIPVVSLLSDIEMDFVFHDESKEMSVIIPRRSLIFLEGEARYGWRHAISTRKTDAGKPRERRISLTFRKCVSVNCSCPYPLLCDSQGADMTRPRRLVEG